MGKNTPNLVSLIHNIDQVDQIGRIFSQWAIVYFEQLKKITEIAQISGHILSQLCRVMQQF
jgi:hypothetical protein